MNYRYLFHIAYKGSNYRGWQKQINAVSIQETIENVLSKFLKERIHCIGCGRTDAGVHASQYYFHIDASNEIDKDLLYAFNKILPHDITVIEFDLVHQKFHAQHSAIQRTYNYFIHTESCPYVNELSSRYEFDLDGNKMQAAAKLLVGEIDFRAFCKTPDRHNHTICKVSKAQIYKTEDNKFFRFDISANRFLKGMIRIIVSQLLKVGQGKLSVEEFHHQLQNKITPNPLQFAFPQGLYLSEIKYAFNQNVTSFEHCIMLNLKDWKAI